MELKEKIKKLKLEQDKAKEVFIKLQGAIEVLTGMLEEEKASNKK